MRSIVPIGHSPGMCCSTFPFVGLDGNQRREFHDPPIVRCMVYNNAAFFQNLL